MPRIDRNIENSPLFKYFIGEQRPGSAESEHLPDAQRNHLSGEGAALLHEYARTREYDGRLSRDGFQRVDANEATVVRYIIDQYPHLLSLEGRVRLADLFNVDLGDGGVQEGQAPRKDAPITFDPAVKSQLADRLARVSIENLPELFTREYTQRRGELEGRGTPEERSARVLTLFRDYCVALWARGEQPQTERVGIALMDAFEQTRSGNILGSRNANGAGWSAAQGMVLGVLDPNTFKTDFPKAGKNVATTYLAMNDGNAPAMKVVDGYLKLSGRGQQAQAEGYEKKSVLAWVLGQEAGNNKFGNFDEKRPFSTSGLNWGVVLFPGDRQIANLQPLPGFEFPIDALNAFGYFIRAEPEHGNRLEVRDEQGNKLRVEKQIHNDAEGKPTHWSAKFFRGDEEVSPAKALGVIVQNGRVKGDGVANQSVSMGWWGKCDRNAAMGAVKDYYDVPELNADQIRIPVGDKVISMSKEMGQRLIDTDLIDMTQWSFMGFRFNNEPQQVQLKDGRTLQGRISGKVIESGANIKPLDGDMVAVHGTAESPLLGTVKIEGKDGRSDEIEARDILRVEKHAGEDTYRFVVKSWNGERTISGKTAAELPFAGAAEQDGVKVLDQQKGFPIRGEVEIQMADGRKERVNAKSIDQIVGETEHDVRPSQFMSWISKHDGVYVLDTALREMVANGRKWTNRLELSEHTEGRPEWAPEGDLNGRYGKLERQPGDKMTWVRGHSDSQWGSSVHCVGWIQRAKNGRIVNEGFTRGAPDFGWAPSGQLRWDVKSTNNPYFPPEFRKALFVNGVNLPEAEKDALMQRLGLPEWRNYVADPNKAVTPLD